MVDRKKRIRGSSLLEVVTVSTFLAVSSMGLGSALISGTTLSGQANRRMSQVATAENIMEQIRQVSYGDLRGVVTDYDGVATAAHSSIGFSNDDKRSLTVRVPLSESSVPGGIDLNGNGELDASVDPGDARILVVDIEGSGRLRLRTAILNFDKLPGIFSGRDKKQGDRPVVFGETYDEPVTETETETPPPPTEETQSTVCAISTDMNGKTAEVVLLNEGTENRTVKSITIAPEKEEHYFQGIFVNGQLIFETTESQEPGTVTLQIESEIALAPGEGMLSVGEFYKWDTKNSQWTGTTPRDVTLTITFDDGSVVTAVVTK